jgi:phage-related protein
MKDLGALQPETLKTASARPWVWLVEGTLEQTLEASPCFRVTSHDQEITYDGDVYHPYPLVIEPIQSSGHDMPSIRIVLSNATRIWSRYLFAGGGMVGQAVTVTLTHVDHLDAGTGWTFVVGGCDMTDESFALTLQLPDFWSVAVPTEVYRAGRCRWRYRSDECGYLGTMADCNKTLSACIAHGDDMAAAGRPRRHPRVFGGFPGIP